MDLVSTPSLNNPRGATSGSGGASRSRAAGRNILRRGQKRRRRRSPLDVLIQTFGLTIRSLGLYGRGLRNARNLKLTSLELAFEGLPPEFDGYTILQLSDLHVDALPKNLRAAAKLIPDLEIDLCVLTGDYRQRVRGAFDHILPELGELVAGIRARDCALAESPALIASRISRCIGACPVDGAPAPRHASSERQ